MMKTCQPQAQQQMVTAWTGASDCSIDRILALNTTCIICIIIGLFIAVVIVMILKSHLFNILVNSSFVMTPSPSGSSSAIISLIDTSFKSYSSWSYLIVTFISSSVLGFPKLTITLISSSAQITLEIFFHEMDLDETFLITHPSWCQTLWKPLQYHH